MDRAMYGRNRVKKILFPLFYRVSGSCLRRKNCPESTGKRAEDPTLHRSPGDPRQGRPGLHEVEGDPFAGADSSLDAHFEGGLLFLAPVPNVIERLSSEILTI